MIALDKPLTKRQIKQAARRKRREAHHRDIESPVRFAVRYPDGGFDAVVGSTGFGPGYLWRAMGTHETLAHARRRLGWT